MDQELVIQIVSYIVVILIIGFVYYEMLLAENDPKAFTKHFLKYIMFIVVPIIIVFGLTMFTSFDEKTSKGLIIGVVIAIMVIGFGYYFLQLKLSNYIFNKYLLYIVVTAIFLVGASIIVTLFSGTLRKLSGWTGFFINLLFYIPCLIRDGLHAAIREYETFSTTLVVLFVLELLLLLMYFFLIPFVNNKIFPKKQVLLEDPVMLNTALPLKVPTDISNNFGISFWTYVNPGPKGKPGYAVESPIFSYMNKEGKPHIQLAYSNTNQGNNDFIMRVGEQNFPLSLPLQKWTNFVFNYTTYNKSVPISTSTPSSTQGVPTTPPLSSWWKRVFSIFYRTPAPTPSTTELIKLTTVDMFVNGILEHSFTYDSSKYPLPTFSRYDVMAIGNGILPDSSIKIAEDGVKGSTGDNANRDGLYGAICNVVYYKQPLTQMALVYNYNLLTIRNPPI